MHHSYVVRSLRGGANLRHIAALLGHGDLETTRIQLRLVLIKVTAGRTIAGVGTKGVMDNTRIADTQKDRPLK